MKIATALQRAGALALASLLFAPIVLHAEDDHKKKGNIYRDMHVMSRVLTESLNRADIAPDQLVHAGASPFDADIRPIYVPTVGTIFTIPVDFPLRDRDDDRREPPEQPTADDEDLWEMFSRGRRDPEPPPPLPDTIGRPGDGERDVRELIIRQRDGESIEETLKRLERARDRDDEDRDRRRRGIRPQLPDFDAEKVETLKNTIASTLATYGHRMDALPDDERILVIVEGPALRIWNAEQLPVLGDIPILGQLFQGHPVRPVGPRDRILISLERGAVSEPASVEALEDALKFIDY